MSSARFKKGHGFLNATARVKREFVEMNRKTFPVAAICRVLGISPSGYYAWRGRRQMSTRARSNEALRLRYVRFIDSTSNVPKMRYELMRLGWRVNHKRVARLMRENGLRSRRAKGGAKYEQA
jgi:transposase InsO family protein